MKSLKTYASLFAAALLAASAAGCSSSPSLTDDAQFTNADQDEILVADQELKDKLTPINFSMRETAGKYKALTALFRVENNGFFSYVFNSYKPLHITYQFVWVDEKGMEYPQDRAHFVNVYPGNQIGCSSVAPKAGDMKVKLHLSYSDSGVCGTSACEAPAGTPSAAEKAEAPAPVSACDSGKKEDALACEIEKTAKKAEKPDEAVKSDVRPNVKDTTITEKAMPASEAAKESVEKDPAIPAALKDVSTDPAAPENK